MTSNEIPYPAAFVYEEDGEVPSRNFQVLKKKDEHIAGQDIDKLKKKLELEKIPVAEITFLTKDQIKKLNLIPNEFIRPYNPGERDELSAA